MREERVVRSAAGALTALIIAFIPLYFLAGYGFAQTALLYGLGSTLLGILAGWVLGKRHAAWQILASALAASLLALVLPVTLPGAAVIRVILMGCGALLAVWAERMFVSPVARPPEPGLLVAPLIALLALCAALWLGGQKGGAAWALALIIGAVWLCVSLFMMNRMALLQAASAQNSAQVPAGARRGGTVGVFAFILLAFALANVRSIVDFIGSAIRAVIAWIVKAMLFLSSLMTQNPAPAPSQAPGGPQPTLPPTQGNESKLGEIIRWVVFGLIVLAIVAAVVWQLTKLIPRLWRKLRERLRRLFATWREEDAGYSDRSESLMNLRQAVASAGARVRKLARRFRRKPTLADFPTNVGKARFLFREFLRNLHSAGRAPAPGATATETARSAPPLALAYNRARYAEEEPSDEQIAWAERSVHPKGKQAL